MLLRLTRLTAPAVRSYTNTSWLMPLVSLLTRLLAWLVKAMYAPSLLITGLEEWLLPVPLPALLRLTSPTVPSGVK